MARIPARFALTFVLLATPIVSAQEPAFVLSFHAVRYQEAPGYYHYVYPCTMKAAAQTPTGPANSPSATAPPALCWPVIAGRIQAAAPAPINPPPGPGIMMVSASTVRFIPNDTKAAPLLPDTPAKDISLRYDPGQATADLLTPAGAYSFAFQTFCLGCTPGVSPIDLATRPQLSAEYAEFMQSLTRFNSVYTRLNNIAALWRIGVTSKNQPSSADPPDAMGLYSELNHRFAAYCSEPARSCVQTYETYQACESAGPQAGCGQPPSCSAFCTLSQDAIRELKAGVCTARIMDSATLFPDWTPVAKKLDAARAAHGPIDPSQIKLTPAPPGPQRDFMGKPVDPDNPCSVEANFSTSILSKLTEIKAPPSPHTAGGAAAAPVMVDGKWQVAMTGNILTRTDPVYPPMAKAAHVQGLVVLMATISAGGSVEELNAVSGPPMLQQAAVEAVKNWTFRPYLIDGKPVEVRSKIAVNFAIGTGEPQAPPAAPPQ